jgi:hypothetical protein
MTRRFQDPAYFLINQAMKRIPKLVMQDYVRTETTYDAATGRSFIERILTDPAQRRQVMAMADAMVPALPRFDGVANDLAVQQELDELPLASVAVPTLVVGSRHDGDIGYVNLTHSAGGHPRRRARHRGPVRAPHLVGRPSGDGRVLTAYRELPRHARGPADTDAVQRNAMTANDTRPMANEAQMAGV